MLLLVFMALAAAAGHSTAIDFTFPSNITSDWQERLGSGLGVNSKIRTARLHLSKREKNVEKRTSVLPFIRIGSSRTCLSHEIRSLKSRPHPTTTSTSGQIHWQVRAMQLSKIETQTSSQTSDARREAFVHAHVYLCSLPILLRLFAPALPVARCAH